MARSRTPFFYLWALLMAAAVALGALAWQDTTHWLAYAVAAVLCFIVGDGYCFRRRYRKPTPPPQAAAECGPTDEVPPPTVVPPYTDADMVADVMSGRCDDSLIRLIAARHASTIPARRVPRPS